MQLNLTNPTCEKVSHEEGPVVLPDIHPVRFSPLVQRDPFLLEFLGFLVVQQVQLDNLNKHPTEWKHTLSAWANE